MATMERGTLTPAQVDEIADEMRRLADAASEAHADVELQQVLEVIQRRPVRAPSIWVRSTEAAEMLGVSRNTVKKWARTGYLRGARQDPDGWWHIPRASVERVAAAERLMDTVPDLGDDALPWRE
jgi:excisionase family DNA binding protein